MTCASCGRLVADRYKVMTDVGQVVVTQCLVCDRGKCGRCMQPVRGAALRCPQCSHPILPIALPPAA